MLNGADDEPAASADVIAEAARLLGAPPPPLVPFAEAVAGMSAMGRSFWADNRKVRSAADAGGARPRWRYPTYREGLRAILAEQGSTAARSSARSPAATSGAPPSFTRRDLHVAALDPRRQAQRRLPRHVGVRLAVQQPHRAGERDRAPAADGCARPRSARG